MTPAARRESVARCASSTPATTEERVRAAYGAETYDRLVALKRRYDPENVLRRSQNVDPDYRSAAGHAIR